jgi:hypothetical protein
MGIISFLPLRNVCSGDDDLSRQQTTHCGSITHCVQVKPEYLEAANTI